MKRAKPIKAVLYSLLILVIVSNYSYPQDAYSHLAPKDRIDELAGPSRELADFASRNRTREALADLEEAVGRLRTHPGKKVLDLGCGTGLKTKEMSEHDPDALVIGIDIDKNRLRSAKKKYPHSKNPNLYFFSADAQSLLFPDNSFDLITIYYPNPIQPGFAYDSQYFYMTFLQEAVRVARNGATIMVESEDQYTQRVIHQAMFGIGKCKVNPPFERKGEYLIRKLTVTVRKDVQTERSAGPIRVDPDESRAVDTAL